MEEPPIQKLGTGPEAGQILVWGFPKIGDPNIVPQIVGSLLHGPPKTRYPLFKSHGQMYQATAMACGASRIDGVPLVRVSVKVVYSDKVYYKGLA